MPTVTSEAQVVVHSQLEDGTVRNTFEDVFVYVHCINPNCESFHDLHEGLKHELKVPGLRNETMYTFADRGGDLPGPENSHVSWACLEADDAVCPDCGGNRNVSHDPSREIQRHNLGPGDGLKGMERAAALALSKSNQHTDSEVEALKAQVAELTGLVKESQKPKGGRPRKDGTPAQSKNDPDYTPPED